MKGSAYVLPPRSSEAGSSFDFLEPTCQANGAPARAYWVGNHLKRFKLNYALNLIGVMKNDQALGLGVVF